jgi:hypothetical protein
MPRKTVGTRNGQNRVGKKRGTRVLTTGPNPASKYFAAKILVYKKEDITCPL